MCFIICRKYINCTINIPEVLRRFSKKATDFSDLLEGRDHPFVIGS